MCFDKRQTLGNIYAFVSVPHDPVGIWTTYWHSAILNSFTHASQCIYCYLSVEINRWRDNPDIEEDEVFSLEMLISWVYCQEPTEEARPNIRRSKLEVLDSEKLSYSN